MIRLVQFQPYETTYPFSSPHGSCLTQHVTWVLAHPIYVTHIRRLIHFPPRMSHDSPNSVRIRDSPSICHIMSRDSAYICHIISFDSLKHVTHMRRYIHVPPHLSRDTLDSTRNRDSPNICQIISRDSPCIYVTSWVETHPKYMSNHKPWLTLYIYHIMSFDSP